MIQVDRSKLERALALYGMRKDQDGVLGGGFVGLARELHIASLRFPELRRVHARIEPLRVDFSSLLTLIGRMQWQLELRNAGQMNEGFWVPFACLDIEHFLAAMRATFDRVAGALGTVAPIPQQVPKRFSQLRELASSHHADRVLGSEIMDLVASCDWFDDLRTWRNVLVHQDGWTLAFIEGDSIPFQLNRHFDTQILVPEVMHNEYCVDFRMFAALFLSYLLVLLEDLDLIVRRKLQLPLRLYHYSAQLGATDLRTWTETLLARTPAAAV